MTSSETTMHKIVSFTADFFGNQTEYVIEYCDGIERVIERMRDWAAYHGVIDNLSTDGLFFYFGAITFRAEQVR